MRSDHLKANANLDNTGTKSAQHEVLMTIANTVVDSPQGLNLCGDQECKWEENRGIHVRSLKGDATINFQLMHTGISLAAPPLHY